MHCNDLAAVEFRLDPTEDAVDDPRQTCDVDAKNGRRSSCSRALAGRRKVSARAAVRTASIWAPLPHDQSHATADIISTSAICNCRTTLKFGGSRRKPRSACTERELNAMESDFKEYPKTLAPTDFWGQVKRTVNGQAVSEEQIQMILALIRRELQLDKDDRLLDLACGNGALSQYLFADCREFLGVDFSEVLIDVARIALRTSATSLRACRRRTLCAAGILA
jgi:hypothetical protein